MKPTNDQIWELTRNSEFDAAQFRKVIKAWEKIRPADPSPDLPEWIPISERLPTEDDADEDGEVLWYVDGCVATQNYEDSHPSTHWLPISAIAALPKRQAPTKEDKDAAEFEAWLFKNVDTSLIPRHVIETIKAAWMAARKSHD